MKQYICIDIGGTSIKYGIIQEDAAFLVTGEMPTEAMQYGGPGIMKKAVKIIEDYLVDYSPAGICISTAGMVDCEEGRITHSAPLIPEYTGTEIKKTLEEKFHLPCEVENDVNCLLFSPLAGGFHILRQLRYHKNKTSQEYKHISQIKNHILQPLPLDGEVIHHIASPYAVIEIAESSSQHQTQSQLLAQRTLSCHEGSQCSRHCGSHHKRNRLY